MFCFHAQPRQCCTQFRSALPSLIFSSHKLPSSRKLPHQSSLSVSLDSITQIGSRKKEPEAAAFSSPLSCSSWGQEGTQDRNHHMVSPGQENQACYPYEEKVKDLSRISLGSICAITDSWILPLQLVISLIRLEGQ